MMLRTKCKAEQDLSPSVFEQEAKRKLGQGYEFCKRSIVQNSKSPWDSIERNLVQGLCLKHYRDAFPKRNKNFEKKFMQPHSSAALLFNCFVPLLQYPSDLNFFKHEVFAKIEFEKKCYIGLSSPTCACLDIVLSSNSQVIGIESKLIEHLGNKTVEFNCKYRKQIQDERRNQGYFKEMRQLEMEQQMGKPCRYRHLDAAQLIKHAFGLSKTFKNETKQLLYIFWEPINWQSHQVFIDHRSEIKEFSNRVQGSFPAFHYISYPELWARLRQEASSLLCDHIDQLERRYLFVL